MHRGRTAAAAGLCIAAAAGLAAAAAAVACRDREGPEIAVQNEQITYSAAMTSEELTQYASAVDQRDGDVSGSLMVEKIRVSGDGKTAQIVYAASDTSGNVTKLVCEVPCAQSDAGAQQASEPAEQYSGEAAEAQAPEKTGTPEEASAAAGQEAAEGTDGTDSAYPETQTNPEAPKLTLAAHTAEVPQGAGFEALSYVQEITDDRDGQELLYGQIQISGEVNTAEAGSYELVYWVTDSDGNRSNEERLIVTVR